MSWAEAGCDSAQYALGSRHHSHVTSRRSSCSLLGSSSMSIAHAWSVLRSRCHCHIVETIGSASWNVQYSPVQSRRLRNDEQTCARSQQRSGRLTSQFLSASTKDAVTGHAGPAPTRPLAMGPQPTAAVAGQAQHWLPRLTPRTATVLPCRGAMRLGRPPPPSQVPLGQTASVDECLSALGIIVQPCRIVSQAMLA